MKFINKSSVIGFTLGAIISPLIVLGGLYLYVRTLMNDTNELASFPPPQIPVYSSVDINWNLITANGAEINLEDQFKDQVVFINFWATWCPPCIAEMPTIEKLYQKYKDKIGFAMISNEYIGMLEDFRNRNKYTFPVYQIEMDVPEVFDLNIIPATYIISPDRKIVLKHVGGADWSHEDVTNFLDALLDDKSESSADSKLNISEHPS
ncbi:MAG: TlpA family protein disulfide reductase [Deltaproteobacteria bacterium]|jgi:thiol-disulfide isomerase/thioredoxin|nr:TlpA family protein disulfide reductase [Deltaproteobacteria bacterium]